MSFVGAIRRGAVARRARLQPMLFADRVYEHDPTAVQGGDDA